MAIIYKQGDMFSDQSEAIVNTVNCVGVMGKGVALEFKRRWPENFKAYKRICDAKQLTTGQVFIFDNGDMFSDAKHRYLINFPTKQHWRAKSQMSYVEAGLDDFIEQLKVYAIKSVAMPPLGCGNGGLPWTDVRPLIEDKLADVDGIDFHIYAPREHKTEPEYKDIPPEMTFGRAMLVKTIGEFEKYFGGHLTRISLQKIVYFLQAMGVSYGMTFERNKHGPYSKELSTIFKALEKNHYIEGYTADQPEIQAARGAFSQADEYLSQPEHVHHLETITKLGLLIEGYESPYGMELLSSVHYLATHENVNGVSEIVTVTKSWNDYKNDQFSERAIEFAYARLQKDGLIPLHR